jgi:hypothetical protein
LISGPSQTAKTSLFSFNRTQSKVVTGLFSEHNTLRRHLYLVGMTNIPLCRRCRIEEETSVHVLSECEILVSLRHAHLVSFFLDPEDVNSLSLGAIWNFSKELAPIIWHQFMGGTMGPSKGLGASGPKGLEPSQ